PRPQALGIDVQRGHAPVGIVRGGKPKLQGVLKKPILCLEVLGREEHALRPDNTVPALHGLLDLLPVFPKNGCNFLAKRVPKVPHGVKVQYFGEACSASEAARNRDQAVGWSERGERRRDSYEGEITQPGRPPDFDLVTQSCKQIGNRRKLRELQVHETGTEHERPNSL